MSFSLAGKKMNPKKSRSRTGCETCRVKHVRCDERKPNCNRCTRLSRICTWPPPRKPLNVQRRGFGPLKSRDGFQPKEILPAPKDAGTALSLVSDSYLNPANEGGADESWTGWNLDDGDFPFLTSFNGPDLYSQRLDPCFNIETFAEIFENGGDGFQTVGNLPELLLGPSTSLSDHHVALPNSLNLTAPEHEALRHYQTTYSLYRTTKDPNWSTHKVLLSLGFQNPMIMHFLLAVSINDWSLRKGQNVSSQEAENHFQAGARLLIDRMKVSAETDHVSNMAAYFFIYLYMSKRKSTAPQRLTQLSLTVLDYVEKYELNVRCVEYPETSTTLITSPKNDNSLLARLIMWTFDEDVKCSFQSTGGFLARHLTQHSGRTKDVYEASRNALANHWGADYPNSQQLDDDLNSTVLEFLWAMMPLWQDINDLPHEPGLISLESRSIEHTFSQLEQKYASVFRLSADVATKPRPRVLVNADYDVVLFNALRIYYFRSTLSDLSIKSPPDIQGALKTLLTIIRRTFATRGTELHDRLQWPLFLAGIEIDDDFYRDWIFPRLTSERIATSLQQTVDAQTLYGRRLRMSEIRQMLYDTEDLSLSGGSTSFLNIIQEF